MSQQDNWTFDGWRRQHPQQPENDDEHTAGIGIMTINKHELATIEEKKTSASFEAKRVQQEHPAVSAAACVTMTVQPVAKSHGIRYCWAHQLRFAIPRQEVFNGPAEKAPTVALPKLADRTIVLEGRQWKHVTLAEGSQEEAQDKVRPIDDYLLHLEVQHRLIVGNKSLAFYYQAPVTTSSIATPEDTQHGNPFLPIPYADACHELGLRERFGVIMAARAIDVERHLLQRGRRVSSKNLNEIALLHGFLVAPREQLVLWKSELAAGVRTFARNATAATRLVPKGETEATPPTPPQAGSGSGQEDVRVLEGKTEEERMLEVLSRARDDAVGHFADSDEPIAQDNRHDPTSYRLSMPKHWHRILDGISYWKFREAPSIRSVPGQLLSSRSTHARTGPYRRF
jgi:hypothetical protein